MSAPVSHRPAAMPKHPLPACASDQSVPLATQDWHPLELLPFFRRWPHSAARDLLYTVIWNLLLGSAFVLLGLLFGNIRNLPKTIWVTQVITQCVGFSIHGLFSLGKRLWRVRLMQAPFWLRTLYFITVPSLGVLIGYFIAFTLLDMQEALRWLFSGSAALSITLVSLMISAVLTAVLVLQEKQARSTAELAAERQRTLDAERRALAAQLRMLQAQIEPHFLYNTLANAVGLIEPAPDKARLLLERLIDYLRASLTASRESDATLDQELATVRSYLELMQVRMGERLRYRIDYPAELARASLPPMLLQPLVENAIQHGLEPKVTGGEITVVASAEHGQLQITVSDDGQGFDPAARPRPGGGIGLANLRERLASLYGTAATLSLADHPPSGVKVTLRIPLTPTA